MSPDLVAIADHIDGEMEVGFEALEVGHLQYRGHGLLSPYVRAKLGHTAAYMGMVLSRCEEFSHARPFLLIGREAEVRRLESMASALIAAHDANTATL